MCESTLNSTCRNICYAVTSLSHSLFTWPLHCIYFFLPIVMRFLILHDISCLDICFTLYLLLPLFTTIFMTSDRTIVPTTLCTDKRRITWLRACKNSCSITWLQVSFLRRLEVETLGSNYRRTFLRGNKNIEI